MLVIADEIGWEGIGILRTSVVLPMYIPSSPSSTLQPRPHERRG